LPVCFRRAYRDFSRTLRGIANYQERYAEAEESLKRTFAAIRDMPAPTEAEFDDWHRRGCERLMSAYGTESLTVGQAQKWLNMTFKYIFVLGEQRLGGFIHLYDRCHVPLDRVVLQELKGYGLPPLTCPWSRLNSYNTYLDLQKWVRAHFDLAPLDVEFRLWMGQPIQLSASWLIG
jgi:hypothetical protein